MLVPTRVAAKALGYMRTPYVSGQMKEKFHMKKRRLGSVDSTLEPSCLLPKESVQKCATAECHPQNSETILTDKSNNSASASQTTKLSKTSEAVSTSKERDLYPFWNEFCQEMSKKLWLPTKTDCADSDSISSNVS